MRTFALLAIVLIVSSVTVSAACVSDNWDPDNNGQGGCDPAYPSDVQDPTGAAAAHGQCWSTTSCIDGVTHAQVDSVCWNIQGAMSGNGMARFLPDGTANDNGWTYSQMYEFQTNWNIKDIGGALWFPTGATCQIDPCAGVTCQDHATCGSNGACTCNSGYHANGPACDIDTPPASTYTGTWYFGDNWSGCDATCGVGTKTLAPSCTTTSCDPATRPADRVKYCATGRCKNQCNGNGNKDCYRRVRTSGCSASCGGGKVSFNIVCNGKCNSQADPGLRGWRPCNIHPCPGPDQDNTESD